MSASVLPPAGSFWSRKGIPDGVGKHTKDLINMAKIREIAVEFRADEGKGASRRLRLAGKVPAILYGLEIAPRALQLDQLKVQQWLAKEWFYTSILELSVGGEKQKALLRDVQRHPYKPICMHLDFQRISETETLRLRVPLHFLNQEKSPAGKTGGSLILHELNDVEIQCLPKDLPEYLEVDLIELKIGDTLHLSDVKLPAGVEIPELKFGKEHDSAIVVARMPAAESDEPTEAPEAGAVEAAKQKAPEAKAAAAPAKGGKAAAPAKAAPAPAPAKKK